MSSMYSPFIELNANGNIVRNLFYKLDIWLSRKEPADIADFTLKPGLPDLGLVKDSPVEITIGYNSNESWKVFAGYIKEPMAPRFLCKDEAMKLFKTKIVQSFMGVTPQDVIRYGLQQAGVQEGSIAPGPFTQKQRFVVAGENVSDMVKRVNTTWGLNFDQYFDSERKFYWDNPKPKLDVPVYSYRYGENIIDLQFNVDREPLGQRSAGSTSGSGRILTVASPFVGHSQEIEILWPQVYNTRFLVETVHHFINEKGSLRTELFFRELEAN